MRSRASIRALHGVARRCNGGEKKFWRGVENATRGRAGGWPEIGCEKAIKTDPKAPPKRPQTDPFFTPFSPRFHPYFTPISPPSFSPIAFGTAEPTTAAA